MEEGSFVQNLCDVHATPAILEKSALDISYPFVCGIQEGIGQL